MSQDFPDYDEPTNAAMLASLITGNGSMGLISAAVQRSHRFPIHIFIQIENMARLADTSVSVIINQLLECGLDAVKAKLPDDVAQQLSRASEERLKSANKVISEEVKERDPMTGKRGKAKK